MKIKINDILLIAYIIVGMIFICSMYFVLKSVKIHSINNIDIETKKHIYTIPEPTEFEKTLLDAQVAGIISTECTLEEMEVEKHSVLTASKGVNYYHGYKETYYNLNMSYVVEIAHSRGIEGEFWVRDDGVKMLGNYIMVAACYNIHSYGSIVETSLGKGIVVDTGEFANTNPYQFDIAVDW